MSVEQEPAGGNLAQMLAPFQHPDVGKKIVPACIVVSGDRHWGELPPYPKQPTKEELDRVIDQERRIRQALMKVNMQFVPTYVLHGDCRGADRMVAKEAKRLGLNVEAFPYIEGHGKAGGPMRNRKMLEELDFRRTMGMYTAVVIFHDNLEKSRGTADMINQALGYRFAIIHA